LLRLILLFALLAFDNVAAFAQQISNDSFQLQFSSVGLKTLKHTHDAFDTNYILAGRALGGVFVRYRTPGGAWQEVASATAGSGSNHSFSYKIGRAIPTIATASRSNSSIGPWGTHALNDQIEPVSSHDRDIPFFAWGERHGTGEWVEYQFAKPDGHRNFNFSAGHQRDFFPFFVLQDIRNTQFPIKCFRAFNDNLQLIGHARARAVN
jgi:hypothetical protein